MFNLEHMLNTTDIDLDLGDKKHRLINVIFRLFLVRKT